MAKATLKTAASDQSVLDFVQSIEHPSRRQDAQALLDIFKDSTGLKPKMWGSAIIGYGRYEYRYESGREGEFFLTGFSPRKANLSIYILPGYEDLSEPLARLGKHKLGKSCLYINKLADIDIAVLKGLIRDGLKLMQQRYETYES